MSESRRISIAFVQHSTFLLGCTYAYLLFDWYDTPSGVDLDSLLPQRELPIYIFCTHSHSDHYNPHVFELFPGREVYYLFHEELTDAVPSKYLSRVIFLKTGQEYCSAFRVRAYGSTDEGGSFYIEIPQAQGEMFRIFYAGDLNYWHWNEEADDYHISLYTRDWQRELKRISADNPVVDLLFFPTDLRLGKDFLLGLEQFLDQVPVTNVVPMHLNGYLPDSAELEKTCSRHGARLLALFAQGDVLSL